MIVQLSKNYDEKHKKGHVMVADKIIYSEKYAGKIGIRIVGEWKQPTWFSIYWFVNKPKKKF